MESKRKRNYHKDNLFSVYTTGSDSPELLTRCSYIRVWIQIERTIFPSGPYRGVSLRCLVSMAAVTMLGKRGPRAVTNTSTGEHAVLTLTLRNLTARQQSLADSPQLVQTALSASAQTLQTLQTQSPWQPLSESEGQVPVHKCMK